jgi:hypothetical protein
VKAQAGSSFIAALGIAAAGSCLGCRADDASSTQRVSSDPTLHAPGVETLCDGNLLDDESADSAAAEPPDADVVGSPYDAAPLTGSVKHAIIISVDGLNASFLTQQLSLGQLPNYDALRQWGASTTRARTDVTYTMTLPDHTSILTGRPVSPVDGLPADVNHGYYNDGMPQPGETLHNAGNPALKYVYSAFDVAHDNGFKTCMYAGKAKFILYSHSYNVAHGADDAVGVDNGRNKIDRCVLLEGNTDKLVALAAADMAAGRCDLVFFHIADLDLAGHATSWGSATWLQVLAQSDDWVGTLSQFASPQFTGDRWGLVLTADHGGTSDGHSDATDYANYRIPFFLVSPNVKSKVDLYSFVGDRRRDPGIAQPEYTAPGQPVRNGDAANVALGVLGLPPVPGSLMKGLLGPQ